MKIVVCFKAITDYGRLSKEDWVWDEHYSIEMSFVRRIFNCFDESALEIALKLSKLSDSVGLPSKLTALTIDDQKGDLFLKHLCAVGYDAVRIQPELEIDLRFNPIAVSHLIAAYVKQAGQQLVLLGQQGGDGDNRQTGLLVAERLGWPCIRGVTEIVITESKNHLTITSQSDGHTLVQTVKLPMVSIIGQSVDSPYLRIPTLKQKLAVKKKEIKVLSIGDLDIKGNLTDNNDKSLIQFLHPHKKPACLFIEGENPREQAQILYNQYLKERLVK